MSLILTTDIYSQQCCSFWPQTFILRKHVYSQQTFILNNVAHFDYRHLFSANMNVRSMGIHKSIFLLGRWLKNSPEDVDSQYLQINFLFKIFQKI